MARVADGNEVEQHLVPDSLIGEVVYERGVVAAALAAESVALEYALPLRFPLRAGEVRGVVRMVAISANTAISSCKVVA